MTDYPVTLRRQRIHPLLRDSLKEVFWNPKQLIAPIFVNESLSRPEDLKSLAGHQSHTVESSLKYTERLLEKNISSVLLFGVPQHKHHKAAQTLGPKSIMGQTLTAFRKHFGNNLFSWVDVCLCSYTESGQCGFLNEHGWVDNESTVHHLAETALSYAQAGAGGIAPSDMMDGRIAAIRTTLNAHRFEHIPIMSYAAKFASQFYGPFREAAHSAPQKKSDATTSSPRANYQIDPGQRSDALRSALRDWEEGADILMVKPGLPYLDILRELKLKTEAPLAVYQVSGEYASLMALAEKSYGDARALFEETTVAFRRAGAQLIITYAAETLVDGGVR